MTELELYKFIKENDIEWHRHDNNGVEDIIIFPSFLNLEAFRRVVSSDLFDDEGIECRMKDGYLCIWMKDICEYYGIDMNKVFEGDDWH